MVRVGGAIVIRHMAARTGVRGVVVIAVVALVAAHAGVRSNEGESTVVVSARRPSAFRVAQGAIGGELRCRVVRVRGAIVVRHMTTIAIGWRALVTIGMALQAIHSGVAAGQWEARDVVVV